MGQEAPMAERPGFVNLLERIRTRRHAPQGRDSGFEAQVPHLPPPDYVPPGEPMPTEQAELPFQPRRARDDASERVVVDGDRPSTMAQRLFAWSRRRDDAEAEQPRDPPRARATWQDQWGFGVAGLALVLIAGAGAIFHWSGTATRADTEATRAEPPPVTGAPAGMGRPDRAERVEQPERTEKIGRPDRAAPPTGLPEPKRAEGEPPPRQPEPDSDRTAPPAHQPPAAAPPPRERKPAPRQSAGAAEFARQLIGEKRISAACVSRSGGAAKALAVWPLRLSEAGAGEFAVRRQGACCKEGTRCGVAIYARGEAGFRAILLSRPADRLRAGTGVHHGYRDLRHQDRRRAAGPFETVFRFDGQRYQRVACFEARWTGAKPARGDRPHGKWQRVECAGALAGKAKPRKARETADIEEPPAE
jgi:hypothetical protein